MLKYLILSAFLIPVASSGQLLTDQVPRERTVPTRSQVEEEVEKRQFRLGPFRLNPLFRLSNAGYDSNVFGAASGKEVSDWKATATAGVQWVVPVGSKFYVDGEALPQYTWYRDLAGLRTFGGVYRSSLLGFFNRASLEVGGYNSKSLGYITSETETKVVQVALGGLVKAEVDMASKLSLFGGVEVAKLRYADDTGLVDVSQFQRTEGGARAGVRYRISPAWDVSVGYEKTLTGFVNLAEQRDNQSDAYLLGVHYDRPSFYVNLYGGYRQGRPFGSSFSKYSTPTGSYFASYYLMQKVELQAYGGRRVAYGLTSSHFIETRNGGGLNVQVHSRVLLRGFGDFGTNDFSGAAGRTDKIRNYGGGFSAIVFRKAVLTALATRSTYRSSQPGLGRSVVRFATGLSFDGEFSR